jgi:hypothetical protein
VVVLCCNKNNPEYAVRGVFLPERLCGSQYQHKQENKETLCHGEPHTHMKKKTLTLGCGCYYVSILMYIYTPCHCCWYKPNVKANLPAQKWLL